MLKCHCHQQYYRSNERLFLYLLLVDISIRVCSILNHFQDITTCPAR